MSRFASIPQALPSIPAFLPQSVQCKLFRAKEHLAELNSETKRYFQAKPAKVVRPPD
jgi:hypothetical protein